jgi:hypothetical protein
MIPGSHSKSKTSENKNVYFLIKLYVHSGLAQGCCFDILTQGLRLMSTCQLVVGFHDQPSRRNEEKAIQYFSMKMIHAICAY